MIKFLLCILLIAAPVRANAATYLEEFASPVLTPAVTPLLIGTGLTVGLVLLKDQIDHPFTRSMAEHKPLGSVSRYGDYAGRLIPNGAYFMGMIIVGLSGEERGFQNAAVMFFSSFYSAMVATGLKTAIKEHRPNGSTRSFPSGHTTTAFAFASTVQARHGWAWGGPAYALAALVGFSRMNDNRHYLHDVVMGATLGISYGLGMDYFRSSAGVPAKVSLAPIFGDGTKGLKIGFRF